MDSHSTSSLCPLLVHVTREGHSGSPVGEGEVGDFRADELDPGWLGAEL